MQDQNEQLSRIQAALDSLNKPSPDPRLLDALLETLNVNPVVTMTAMSALLERHDTGVIELRKEEIQFLRAGIARLKEQSTAAFVTKIKSWTVTSFEVEKGFLFGWDLTSTVRTARWLGKLVGLIEVSDEQTVLRLVKVRRITLRDLTLTDSRYGKDCGATVFKVSFILPLHRRLIEKSRLSWSIYRRSTPLPPRTALPFQHFRAHREVATFGLPFRTS